MAQIYKNRNWRPLFNGLAAVGASIAMVHCGSNTTATSNVGAATVANPATTTTGTQPACYAGTYRVADGCFPGNSFEQACTSLTAYSTNQAIGRPRDLNGRQVCQITETVTASVSDYDNQDTLPKLNRADATGPNAFVTDLMLRAGDQLQCIGDGRMAKRGKKFLGIIDIRNYRSQRVYGSDGTTVFAMASSNDNFSGNGVRATTSGMYYPNGGGYNPNYGPIFKSQNGGQLRFGFDISAAQKISGEIHMSCIRTSCVDSSGNFYPCF